MTYQDPTPLDAAGHTLRHDGWTPDRQRIFLQGIAEGHTVLRACRAAGMTVSSAYALRRRAAGAGFALGWRAANLLAREAIADQMLTRALEGQYESVERPDGSTITRHRYDNRTAMALLARLDRMAEQAPADPAAAGHAQAARLVAQDFEAFLDVIERDQGPASAGLFLARRTGLTGAPAAAPELEPVLALARAHRFTRTGASFAEEIDTADLDPAQRHTWTAEQWHRADAAGLLRVVSPADDEEPDEIVPASPLPPLVDDPATRGRVWWDDDAEEYRTSFPPPDGEEPLEWGWYGDAAYERRLTADEQDLLHAHTRAATADQRAAESAERDEWFAAVEQAILAATDEEAGEGERQEEGNGPDPLRFPGEGRGPVSGCSEGEDDASGLDGDHITEADAEVNSVSLPRRKPGSDGA